MMAIITVCVVIITLAFLFGGDFVWFLFKASFFILLFGFIALLMMLV